MTSRVPSSANNGNGRFKTANFFTASNWLQNWTSKHFLLDFCSGNTASALLCIINLMTLRWQFCSFMLTCAKTLICKLVQAFSFSSRLSMRYAQRDIEWLYCMSVCLSVCLSVRLSRCGIVSEQTGVLSDFYTVYYGHQSNFFDSNRRYKFPSSSVKC